MNPFDIPAEIRRWVILGLAIAALCLCFAVLSMCNGRRDDRAARDVAVTTGKALDDVAEQTPAIRQDQEDKQDAARRIPGASDRLPDGFGGRLECVRRGGRDCNS